MTLRELMHALVWTWRHTTGGFRNAEVVWLSKYIERNDVCFDVGAHAGSWAIPLSHLVDRGHVYAFEALPYYANVLRMVLRIMRRQQVTVLNVAVGDHCGPIPIVHRDLSGRRLTGYTHIARLGEPTERAAEVRGTTLDLFCQTIPPGRIRLVKCDVEGAELLVLRGASSMIDAMRPLFYCESNLGMYRQYGYTINDMFEFWDKHQYLAYVVSPTGGFCRADAQSVPAEGDLLFAPAEMSIGAD